jgi:hypothetical protein
MANQVSALKRYDTVISYVNGSKTFSKHYQSNISVADIKSLVLQNNCDLGFSTEVLRRNCCECVMSDRRAIGRPS